MKPQQIELHIEQLVLHGFPSRDRAAIGEALQQELQRLIAEQGIQLETVRQAGRGRLDAGSFNMQAGETPTGIGTQIAHTVYQRMQDQSQEGE